MGMWDVKNDADRDQWSWVPFVSVGPLRFGAPHEKVCTALGSEHLPKTTCRYGWCSWVEFPQGITAYYTNGCLGMVAIHARYGPQVTYDGQALVGCAPSELEQWVIDELDAHGYELRYSHQADPELSDLGLIVRVQRAGDVLLTRPLLLAERADVSWDVVPSEEWQRWC